MKQLFSKIIYATFAICIFTSCLKEIKKGDFEKDAISATIEVKVEKPQGHEISLGNMEVKLIDIASGFEYSAMTDDQGYASVDVTYGTYIASTEKKIRKSGIMNIYNGSSEQIRVTPKDPKMIEKSLPLNYSKSGQLIIKEIYFGGCWNTNTNKAYTGKDQYITIYNNSREVAYLDSLCIGVINPLNAPQKGKVSDWVKPGTSELRDSLACGIMVWMFKGTGMDAPVQPGQEVVCCINAINHTETVPASVNLGVSGYYAFYDPKITTMHSVPATGVQTLDLIWRAGPSKAFAVSISCPGVLLFTLGGKNVKDYLRDNEVVNPRNPVNQALNCLFVDKNLVLDGVETLKATSDSKRIRPEVDNGFGMISGSGKGESIIRKIDAEATIPGSQIIYVDTNNSTNDFEILQYATLTGKK
ncbi:MAG: DUF4876 domain-containing protein [Bacteroidales bacterium]